MDDEGLAPRHRAALSSVPKGHKELAERSGLKLLTVKHGVLGADRDGAYYPNKHVVAVRTRANSYAVAHEFGHAIDRVSTPHYSQDMHPQRAWSNQSHEFTSAVHRDLGSPNTDTKLHHHIIAQNYPGYAGTHPDGTKYTNPKEVFADLYAAHYGNQRTVRNGLLSNKSMREAYPEASKVLSRKFGQRTAE